MEAQVGRLVEWVGGGVGLSAVDVGWSLLRSRSLFERRVVVVGSSCEELVGGLGSVVCGERVSGELVWVFSGQGGQRVGMGAGLYSRFPVFAAVFDEVCGLLDPVVGCSLRDVVFGGPVEVLDHTTVGQAGLFAVQVGLAGLLGSMGLRPGVVVGHSVGEVAAAYVAGVLGLEDACRLVGARAVLMGGLPVGGAMVAVQAGVDELVGGLPDGVDVAVLNTVDSTVVSGAVDVVAGVEAEWVGRGRKVRRLAVSHAFHSVLMEPMLEEFAAAIGGLSFSVPSVSVVSSLTGDVVGGEMGCVDYWVRQVREPVRFFEAVGRVGSRGGVFVELGSDRVLATAVEHVVDGAVAVSVLDRGLSDVVALGRALGVVHGAGWDV
nr:acyltransferase domain-containing protein [Micromonospora sp. DSM 115978]